MTNPPNPPAPPPLPPLPTPELPPVDEILSLAEAKAQCLLEGYVDNPLNNNDAYDKCIAGYTN